MRISFNKLKILLAIVVIATIVGQTFGWLHRSAHAKYFHLQQSYSQQFGKLPFELRDSRSEVLSHSCVLTDQALCADILDISSTLDVNLAGHDQLDDLLPLEFLSISNVLFFHARAPPLV